MQQRTHRESGIVSLIVTLIMMIVITLIVLGFAEISRNEQRSSLDDQLSAQAYYAAESGINDARAIIDGNVAASQPVQAKTSCGDMNGYNFNGSGESVVDSPHSVSYTCVLVNPNPTTLSYDDVGQGSIVIPVDTASAVNTLSLQWQPSSSPGTVLNCYNNVASNLDSLPITGQWKCNYPVLRVDIYDANSPIARGNWGSYTATMFFVPFQASSVGAGANNSTMASRGSMVPASCSSSLCTANIVGLLGTHYYLHVNALYTNSKELDVSTSGNQAFIGAQATIDSTGKAQDVLRRVLVAVDLTDANAYKVPSAAIISEDSVCKRFGVTSGSFQVYDDLSAGAGVGGNTMCTQQTDNYPGPQP